MGSRDDRIDAYIAAAQPFARPVLEHLRAIVHAACPEVQETMKWRFPHFMYRDRILCSMAAFNAHCAFGLWRGADVLGEQAAGEGMGQYGRLTSVRDLPATRELTRHIHAAMQLTDAIVSGTGGVATPRVRSARARGAVSVEVPPELAHALARHPEAQVHFDAMSPSHRREYCTWIAEAKKPDTRERRIAKALEQLAEGKSQNWKYER